jgi:hypothetical protein
VNKRLLLSITEKLPAVDDATKPRLGHYEKTEFQVFLQKPDILLPQSSTF